VNKGCARFIKFTRRNVILTAKSTKNWLGAVGGKSLPGPSEEPYSAPLDFLAGLLRRADGPGKDRVAKGRGKGMTEEQIKDVGA